MSRGLLRGWGGSVFTTRSQGELVTPLRSPFPARPSAGNAGGGAGRRAAGAAGRPGDVHTADRRFAGRPGGGGVERRERLGEVKSIAALLHSRASTGLT